jgi:hypothetical protein
MPTLRFSNSRLQAVRTLDARTDRPDIRDRIYSPPLRRLAPEFPPPDEVERHLRRYQADGMILNQRNEGACTGFGLGAVINYLLWRKSVAEDGGKAPPKVSERMLYHLARIYDEWPGEDYEGSSCRGAVKGWFYHGVCQQDLWKYQDASGNFVRPKKNWDTDAVTRPLGAYYRIEKSSIPDMQAALCEVGAIYVSATVHGGWNIAQTSALQSLAWAAGVASTGGHAFAIVGYDREGFIVQNSWGSDWGYKGFARLTYEDWLANGGDAWVATMGAQIALRAPSLMLSSTRTLPPAIAHLGRSAALAATGDAAAVSDEIKQWDAAVIERHALVIGNDGRPFPISVTHADAAAAARHVCFTETKQWLENAKGAKKRIVLYAHGGVTRLAGGLARASIMGPCFLENDVYPIFAVWQSGVEDTIRNILEDQFAGQKQALGPAGNQLDRLLEAMAEAKDNFLEAIIARPLVKPLWSEMKENAEGASAAQGALTILAAALAELNNEFDGIEIHLIGHSAGAVMLGAFLDVLTAKKLQVKSLTLYAPACTVGFALKHFAPAVSKKVLDKNRFAIELLSDEREKADSVGPYGKSLLYLVSRALEVDHKTPILGMEGVWNQATKNNDLFFSRNGGLNPDLAAWRALWTKEWKLAAPKPLAKEFINDGEGPIAVAHGCFDNAVPIVSATIERIRNGKLLKPIKTLRGF